MLIAAGMEVVGIGMIPAFVAIVADPERVLSVESIQPVLYMLHITDSKDLLLWGSLALLISFMIKSLYTIAFGFYQARFIFNRKFIISHRLMSFYMQAPYTFHLKRNTAELLRNITQEINLVVSNLLTNILNICKETIMAVSILAFLLYMEPLITLIVILFSGVGAGGFIFFTQKRVKRYGRQEQQHRGNMIKAVQQGLGGIKEARVLNRENEFIKAFREEAYSSSRLAAYMRFIQQIPKPVVETTAIMAMILISALMILQGRPMSTIIPILTLFAMATVRLMPSVQNMSTIYTNLRYNIVALDPIYEDLRDLTDSNKQFVSDRKHDTNINLESYIIAKDISFSYPGSDEKALRNVSFEIPSGKAVAFVGESGAGKTTIVDMLLGLLRPTHGTIKVDGVDIHNNLSAWQKNVGYIPQSIYLSDDSIRNNIAFGVPETEIDDEKVWRAIESAQLTRMIKQLPKGLDTKVGEHGTRISGGQRQRIGIARALYHDPQVIVMDEATSALDNVTEKKITKAIDSLKGNKTIIMIAHRLTTVENCDTLYLMRDGEIIDVGSYDELIERSREFRKMALV